MTASHTETLNNLRGQATHLLQDIIEQATNRAMSETQGSQSRAARLVRPVRRNVAPSARDIALNAASGAIELWQAARERSEGTLSTVQSTVADSATDLKTGAYGITSQGIGAAKSVSTSVSGSARSVSSAVGDSAHRAADTSKYAAVASARAGKSTASLVFWTATAGAIAYFAFLDEDLRNQVKSVAMRAIDEGRAILSEMRGEDGEFE